MKKNKTNIVIIIIVIVLGLNFLWKYFQNKDQGVRKNYSEKVKQEKAQEILNKAINRMRSEGKISEKEFQEYLDMLNKKNK